MSQYCEITLKGHLDLSWTDWFAGLQLTHLEGNVTRLSGQLPDQTALHSLLERIRDLNLTLVSVHCDNAAPSSGGVVSDIEQE